jgi:hypothetical protein
MDGNQIEETGTAIPLHLNLNSRNVVRTGGDLEFFASRLKFYTAEAWTDNKHAIIGLDAGAGKALTFYNYNLNQRFMTLDGDTGDVTITGDVTLEAGLEIRGGQGNLVMDGNEIEVLSGSSPLVPLHLNWTQKSHVRTGGGLMIGENAIALPEGREALSVQGRAYIGDAAPEPDGDGLGVEQDLVVGGIIRGNGVSGTFAGTSYSSNAVQLGTGLAGWEVRINDDLVVTDALGVGELAGTGNRDVYANADGKLIISSSSRRYKKEIKPLGISKDSILKLEPVSFVWKEGDSADIGLIAEEVNQVMPELVDYDAQGNPDGVKYDKIAIYLLGVIKDQQKEIDTLKQAVAALEERGK